MKRTTWGSRRSSRRGGVSLVGTLLLGGAFSAIAGGSAAFGYVGTSPAVGSRQVTLSVVRQQSGGTPVGVPKAPPTLPSNVLLFPAMIPTDSAAAAAALPQGQKDAEAIITDSLSKYLMQGTIGVVKYSPKLPSMQRAVAEGLKPDDAAAGPGDDPRKAQRFSSIIGASEYLTVTIDNYKYDQGSRTVTFDLSISRFGADGAGLGATAVKGIGSAPATVPGSRQESFAVEEAARVAGLQAVEGIYPDTTALITPPKDAHKKHHRGLGGYLVVPVIAVGAAIVGVHS